MRYLKLSLPLLCTFFLHESIFARCHIQTNLPGKWEIVQKGEECTLAKKILDWKNLEDDTGTSFDEIVAFFEKNPTWPNQIALRKKAEENIHKGANPKTLLRWFRKYPPTTTAGALAFVKVAHEKDADTIKNVFTKVKLDNSDLKHFIHHGKKFLSGENMYARFRYLMSQNRTDDAKMMLSHLPKNKKFIAEDCLALARGEYRKRLVTHDPGYMWQYAKYLLKAEKDTDLKSLFAEKSIVVAEKKDPESWWDLRKVLVRRWIEKKNYKAALEVAQKCQATKGVAFVESKWLEGWLNLRFLKNPKKAFEDFQKLYDNVETAVSLSKAAYWASRAAESHKDTKKQKEWLKKSSRHLGTFYGQLSHSLLEEPFAKEDFVISKTERRDFNENELVRVIRLLKKIGNIELTQLFFWKLAGNVEKPDDHELLIALASEVAGANVAVEVTKIGAKHAVPLIEEAYPSVNSTLMPPLFDHHQDVNMQALIHAIIRKESRFKLKAHSNKGAKGLMQILDGTAKQVARSNNIKYGDIFDAKSNIALGEAYLNNLLKRYDGSIILTIAAYNAGPNRVDKWVEQFGYPGQEKGKNMIESVDWINLIPYYETRDYVERVLEYYWRYAISFQGFPIKNWHKVLS